LSSIIIRVGNWIWLEINVNIISSCSNNWCNNRISSRISNNITLCESSSSRSSSSRFSSSRFSSRSISSRLSSSRCYFFNWGGDWGIGKICSGVTTPTIVSILNSVSRNFHLLGHLTKKGINNCIISDIVNLCAIGQGSFDHLTTVGCSNNSGTG